MSVGSRVNRIDRKAATPMVPPIWRKNVTDDVATPISCGRTAFCTARMTGWKLNPRPRPSSTMNGTRAHTEVSAPTVNDIATRATTMKTTPTSGKILYLPVLLIVMPEPMAPVMMPATSGIICRPATVGVEPWTICRYSGRSRIPPNMPAPRTTLLALPIAKLRFRKRRSGRRASSPYARSVRTKASSPNAPMA